MNSQRLSALGALAFGVALLSLAAATPAATIWGGPRISYEKGGNDDSVQVADRVTPAVWLTRGNVKGLYNAKTETEYSEDSPTDTEWAMGTTADLPNLEFEYWDDWHGHCPPCVVGQNAVVHLISEDIYVDIKVQFWSTNNGLFRYERSTPSTPPLMPKVVEYYNPSLDHYFITWRSDEIAALDAGTTITGWERTGQSFNTYVAAQANTSAVCRYYIPPKLGNSHFFGRSISECQLTGFKNPDFVLEEMGFMETILPRAGMCPSNTTSVYRVFSNRVDANHRYMTDKTVRDQMVGMGWKAEGDGPDLVVMCAPQ